MFAPRTGGFDERRRGDLFYEVDGNRVAKSVNGVVTRYLVDDLNPIGLPQVVDELTNGAVSRTCSASVRTRSSATIGRRASTVTTVSEQCGN